MDYNVHRETEGHLQLVTGGSAAAVIYQLVYFAFRHHWSSGCQFCCGTYPLFDDILGYLESRRS
jgi:hypothetical protein